MLQVITAIEVLVLGTASVLLALLLMRWTDRRRKPGLMDGELVSPCIFLFDGERLIDASGPAQRVMESCGRSDLNGLRSWLAVRFPDIGALETMVENEPEATLTAQDGSGMTLRATETAEGHLRIMLDLANGDGSGIVVETLSHRAMLAELELLRAITAKAPMLITRRNGQGQIDWANTAYLDLVDKLHPGETRWPIPQILQRDENSAVAPTRRQVVVDQEVNWFDCREEPLGADGVLSFGIAVDAEVRAELSLRDFLQTLTKTFADLPIGMAIFDSSRQLQLFNPALIDLTGLSAGFLSGRPTLLSVLDQLRELRMVPEPRDYRSWRRQITTLEAAAAAGYHVETWALPGGRTYRVTGRPHPGGAIAFLFEDITSEITLTRKFRAELSVGMQVLDGLDEALIMVNAMGKVSMTNKAYADLWGKAPLRLADALQQWTGDWDDAPGLESLRVALESDSLSAPQSGVIFGPEGELLRWKAAPLPGGKRMVRFAAKEEAEDQDAGSDSGAIQIRAS